MNNVVADFIINNPNPLEAEFELNEPINFDCLFELNAVSTVWGGIQGNIQNQADLQNEFSTKQNILTSVNAGPGISITQENGVIKINNTQTSAEWGNITGNLSDQTDLANTFHLINIDLNHKQDALTAGNNITFNGNVISATVPTKVSQLENDNEYLTSDDVSAVALTGDIEDIVGIDIQNPEDGQILEYSVYDGAWINTTRPTITITYDSTTQNLTIG